MLIINHPAAILYWFLSNNTLVTFETIASWQSFKMAISSVFIDVPKTILPFNPLNQINLSAMNAYQEKWLQVLKNANPTGWEISAQGEDIFIKMPHVTDLKLIRDNLPQVIASLSLDIVTPKERLKFIIENGYENFEYILNPGNDELNNG